MFSFACSVSCLLAFPICLSFIVVSEFCKAGTSDGSLSGTFVLIKDRVLLALSHILFSKQCSTLITVCRTVCFMLTGSFSQQKAYGLNGDSSLKVKTSWLAACQTSMCFDSVMQVYNISSVFLCPGNVTTIVK